jgi:hypothetical protein
LSSILTTHAEEEEGEWIAFVLNIFVTPDLGNTGIVFS